MAYPEIIPQGKLLSRVRSNGRVLITEDSNLDAFGRTRVSNPVTVFDAKLQYDLQPLLFETVTATGGTCTHDANEGAAKLAVTTASGSKVLRQSRRYATYQPGKSQSVFVTGNLGTQQAGTRARIGYFDDNNGVFFELTSAGIGIVFRSKVSGVVVDTRVEQADWNCNTFPDLDVTKAQIFSFDMQWLGVGRVRVGFDVDGELLCAHEFYNDNRRDSTYWTTATLPVRYEIENTGTAPATSTMRQICCSVQSEGGFDVDHGYSFSAANAADIAVTTRRPIISIRPTTTFQGITNRIGVVPFGFEVTASANAAYIELVYNGTLTGASFTANDSTNSGVEYDTSATSLSGGVIMWAGFVSAGGNKFESLIRGEFPALLWLTNNIAGTTTTPLTIMATSFVPQASNMRGALRWIEIR